MPMRTVHDGAPSPSTSARHGRKFVGRDSHHACWEKLEGSVDFDDWPVFENRARSPPQARSDYTFSPVVGRKASFLVRVNATPKDDRHKLWQTKKHRGVRAGGET